MIDAKDLNDVKATGIYEPPKAQPKIPYVSVKTAAKLIGMSASRLSTLCSQGRAPAERVGSCFLLPRDWAVEESERRARGMTQAEAARALGVSRQYIGQLVSEGKMALIDGRIPYAEIARQKEGRSA